LLAAVLWLPVWLQIVLFALAVIVGPYRFFFIIPAIVSDALYAPSMHFSLATHWMTLIVLAMLGLHWVVTKSLRIPTVYGLEA
jgi:hypothetical protein